MIQTLRDLNWGVFVTFGLAKETAQTRAWIVANSADLILIMSESNTFVKKVRRDLVYISSADKEEDTWEEKKLNFSEARSGGIRKMRWEK